MNAWLPGLARLAQPQLQREAERLLRLQQQLLQYLGRLSECSERDSSSRGGSGATADGGAPAAQAALGFELQVGPSTIPGAGRGVFMTRGRCPAGGILSLYPGLVYDSAAVEEQQAASALAEDAFAPAPPPWTVDNSYLLAMRCLGRSFLIDGRPFGMSAHLWHRAAAGASVPPNGSWLGRSDAPWLPTAAVAATSSGERQQDAAAEGQQPVAAAEGQQPGAADYGQRHLPHGRSASAVEQALLSQAALGNLFNHRPGGATFELVPLPTAAVPPALARFLPAVHAGGFDPSLHWVPLVLARSPVRAEQGRPAEVWVDYGVDATKIGYHF